MINFMIDELFLVFKPLLVVFASIIIPVAGLIIFFGSCAIAVKAARLFLATLKKRSWNVSNGLKKKVQSLAEKIGVAGGEKIAISVNDMAKTVKEILSIKFEDLRPKMVGKWYDNDYNHFGIFEEGGVYILHIFSYKKDDELTGASLILPAALYKGPNQNLFFTKGTQILDLAYSVEHDTIFIADFGSTFFRMDDQDEKDFGLRKWNGSPIDFDDVQYGQVEATLEDAPVIKPISNEELNIPQEVIDRISAETSGASFDEIEEAINRNIIE